MHEDKEYEEEEEVTKKRQTLENQFTMLVVVSCVMAWLHNRARSLPALLQPKIFPNNASLFEFEGNVA